MDKVRPAGDFSNWLQAYSVSRPVGSALRIHQEFTELLDSHPGEEAIQQFLQRNPFFLAEQLPHCHFVIPKFRLGSQFVTDFVLPEMASGGTTWTLVELEPADAQLTTTRGRYGDRILQGLQQLRDWQSWLEQNRDYATRGRPNGLGLGDLLDFDAWLVVGRRKNVSARFNELRQQTWQRERIQIKSYDRLLEWFKRRAEFWDGRDAALLRMVQSLPDHEQTNRGSE